MGNSHLLKNLRSLIRNSALAYMNEFVWQDVELTEEFKKTYERYLQSNRYDIEFLGATAVITSPSAKYIFVPNQWFVMASYTLDVYEELCRYKDYFKRVSERLHRRPDEYAKMLRDNASSFEKDMFCRCAKEIFSAFCSDEERVEEAVSRLWRFVNDYSWWSGQKTIDRGDFYVSVILNMLNLVNASQGYVADIVYAYANDIELKKLVADVNSFTTNLADGTNPESKADYVPDEEVRETENSDGEVIPKPDRVRIKINGSGSLKEIKYKG